MKWKIWPWPRHAKGGAIPSYGRWLSEAGEGTPSLRIPDRRVQDVLLPGDGQWATLSPGRAAARITAGFPPPWPAPPEGPQDRKVLHGGQTCAEAGCVGETPEDDPREAVAKAIAASDGPRAWNAISDAGKEDYRANADAAQAVLRSRRSGSGWGIVDRLRAEKERAVAENRNLRAALKAAREACQRMREERDALRSELAGDTSQIRAKAHAAGYAKGFYEGAVSERRTAARVKGERE